MAAEQREILPEVNCQSGQVFGVKLVPYRSSGDKYKYLITVRTISVISKDFDGWTGATVFQPYVWCLEHSLHSGRKI